MRLTSGTGLFSHKAQNSPLASDTRAAARERTNCKAEASYAIVPGTPHTHTEGFVSPFAAYGPSLVQLLGQALWSWNLHTTGTWRKGHPWERSELDLSGFSFKASGQAFWKVKCSPCSEIFIAENLPETIEIVISHI